MAEPLPTTETGAAVYAEELSHVGHGIPMWHPEPLSNGQVELGDVGILNGNGFHRLFNVLVDDHHPWNWHGAPDDFTKYRVSRSTRLEGPIELKKILVSPSVTLEELPVELPEE